MNIFKNNLKYCFALKQKMSDLLNFGELENISKEKKDPIENNNKPKTFDRLPEQNLKTNINEKTEALIKKKKKLTNISDPSILEADILNESYSEISNNQIIRVY